MIGQVRLSIAAWAATVLGACVLVPVFSGPFLFTSAFVCAIVTGTGVLLQSWRTPRLLIPLVQLVVLAETMSLCFYRDTLKFLVIPWTDTALAFNQHIVDAMNGINRYSAPLPPDTAFTVFTTGVIALTGLFIHLIAVQFRQASWAGLLLLMMYTVPAATVHGGLSAVWFVPPAIGYIVLLSAEGRSRLARWGRRIGGVTTLEANDQIEASAAGQAGRRIGLTGIAIAALLPALLPSLPEGVFGNGLAGGAGGGTGIGGAVSLGVNPMLDMGKNLRRSENSVALTYTGDSTYLRLTALDQFDGNTWTVGPRDSFVDVDGDFQPAPGLGLPLDQIPQRRYEVRVSKEFRSPWVPVPYPPKSLSIGGKWRYDAGAMDISSKNGRNITGTKFKVTSYAIDPTEDQLRDAVETGPPDDVSANVPRNTPEQITDLAKRITRGADNNRYRQAVALQRYFRDEGGFQYSTQTDSRSGMDAINAFLFESKTGYCEQFATAMALMARTLGIPARVGLGFLPGSAEGNDKHVVRMHDMHAWPELYFEGLGWVRFEPTPALQTGNPPAWTTPANPGAGTPSESASPEESSTSPSATPTDGNVGRENNLPGERDDVNPGGVGASSWWDGSGPRWIGAGLGLIVLALIPWLIRSLIRRRRFGRAPGRPAVEGLWAEVRDTARDVGMDWSESATPRQSGAWLSGRLPEEVRPQATKLARSVEFGRYAGAETRDIDLRTEAKQVREALYKGAPSRQRWRARLLPRSLRWYLSRGSAEASDLLDQFDLTLARLRALILPRRRSA